MHIDQATMWSLRAKCQFSKLLLNVLRRITFAQKGPMNLIQRVRIAHSFLQSVLNLFHFKLAYVVLHMAVKQFFFQATMWSLGAKCQFSKLLLNVLRRITFAQKGPMNLIQRVRIAHSFLQSVLNLFHFKLAYVVLHKAVKQFFESHFYKWRNRLF